MDCLPFSADSSKKGGFFDMQRALGPQQAVAQCIIATNARFSLSENVDGLLQPDNLPIFKLHVLLPLHQAGFKIDIYLLHSSRWVPLPIATLDCLL